MLEKYIYSPTKVKHHLTYFNNIFSDNELISNRFAVFVTCTHILRDRPFNLKGGGGGGLWFFVSFKIFFWDNTRVRIFIIFVAQSAKFFSRI